jgi:hypothetical protein
VTIPDDKLDELLARGRLSGRQVDEIWDNVWDRVEPSTRPRRRPFLRPFFVFGGVLASAAAAWSFFARPAPEHFTPRGEPTVASGAVSIGCASSGRAVCRTGETLMFSVNGALAHGFLGAYAERIGEPSAERIWYFPNAGGASPAVPTSTGTVVLADGIRIGEEQPPGRYRVTIWTSPRAFDRAEASRDDVGVSSKTTLELEVVP